jgi:hypothetical protein
MLFLSQNNNENEIRAQIRKKESTNETNSSRVVSLCSCRPSGVNAFWYFGAGILADQQYYAQALWKANANGHSGTPTWIVYQNANGKVSLSCTQCTQTVATSQAPSAGCTYDITVYTKYPDGTYSSAFQVSINTPRRTELNSVVSQPWPAGGVNGRCVGCQGWQTFYHWWILDNCGYTLYPTLDINETFGTGWHHDFPNSNWVYPVIGAGQTQQGIATDTLAYACGPPPCPGVIPTPLPPQGGSVDVQSDDGWTFSVGTQSAGQGALVHTDNQIFWQDHGSHTAP